ncbi:MAG TPA: hypothetical protein VHB98_13005 [Chloroflexota bacterium]|nr:hypothetical protein [Chloroflexota bacterium]
MDTGEALARLLIQISTVVGVLVSIWWPRKLEAGSPRARAFRALRYAAICLSAGYILIVIDLDLPGETTLWQKILFIAMLGTLPLSPLSSAALALEHGRRLRALYSSYGALLFAAALTWTCIIRMLFMLLSHAPLWQAARVVAAILGAGAGVVFIMELYAIVRRPRAA